MYYSKKITKILLAVIMVSLIACQTAEKKPEMYGYPENELPVSTTSDEAMKEFVEGLAIYDQNKTQQARVHFEKALSLDPNFVTAQMYKVFTSSSAKEFAEGRDAFLSMREMANPAEVIWMDLMVANDEGDDVKFMELSKKLSDTYPKSARAMENLAQVYLGDDEVAKGRELLEKANALNPDYLPVISNLGFSYLFTSPKDFKKAENYMSSVVEKQPNSSRAHIDLGDCYRAQGDLEKALASYERAAELDPTDDVAFSKAGHANSFLGNLDAARKNYQDSRAVSQFGMGAINFEAYTYLYEGDHKKALEFLESSAAKMDGMNVPESNKNMAKMACTYDCAMIAMHYGDAEHLEEVVAMMKPLAEQQGKEFGGAGAIRNQKANMHYWDIISLATAGEIEEAMAKSEDLKGLLSEMNSVNNMMRYDRAMAFIHYKQKNYEEALAHAEKLDSDNVYDQYWMAHANRLVGNEEKAMELFNEIVNNNFNGVGYALILNEVKEAVASTE